LWLTRKMGCFLVPQIWDELTENLSRLIPDPALRSRLAFAGRSKVFSNHNVETAHKPLFQKFTEGVAI
jgi:hypothetical protein